MVFVVPKRTVKSSAMDTSTPAGLKAFIEQAGYKAPKPKAGLLERVFGLPMAVFGSLPDLIYRNKATNEDPLKAYIGNLAQGAKTTFLGEKDLTPQKNFADVMTQAGIGDLGSVKTPVGKITGKGVLGLGADIVTDPSTWMTFGASAAGKGAKAAKFLGKELTTARPAVTAIEALANPIGVAARGGVKAGSKALDFVSPGASEAVGDTLKGIFAPQKLAKKQGLSGVYDATKGFQREQEAIQRMSDVELHKLGVDAGLAGKSADEIRTYLLNLVDSSAATDPMVLLRQKMGSLTVPDNPSLAEQAAIKSTPEYAAKQAAFMDGTAGQAQLAGFSGKQIATEQGMGTALDASAMPKVVKDLLEKAKTAEQGNLSRGLIGEALPGRVARDIKGVTQVFIDNTENFDTATATAIKADKKIAKLLAKGEPVPFSEINRVMDKTTFSVPGFNKGVSDPAKKLEGTNFERKFATQSEGEAAGIVYNPNVGEAITKDITKSRLAQHADDFVYGIPDATGVRTGGLTSLTDDTGKRIIWATGEKDIPRGLSELKIGNSTFWADKDTAKILKNYAPKFFGDENMNAVLSGYDKMLKYWKASVTGLGIRFIPYNIRNAVGDWTNMILDGYRPTNMKALGTGFDVFRFEQDAIKNGYEQAMKKYGDKVVANYGGKALKFKDMYEQASKLGVVSTKAGQSAEQLFEKVAAKGNGKVWDKVKNAWVDVATVKGYAPAREEAFHIAHFLDTYERTGSMKEAADAVRRTLFDYNDLSAVEKNVFKRVIPFYSYMKKNLEFHLQNYAKSPGKYTAMNHLFTTMKKDFGDLSEEDWAALPSWMKEGVAIGLGKKDNIASVLTSFGLPIENIEQTFSKKGLLSSMAPGIKNLAEVATGQNFFKGKKLSEDVSGFEYKNAPDAIKKLLDYKEIPTENGMRYTVNPDMKYLLANLPIAQTALPMLNKGANVLSGSETDALPMLSGMKIYQRDLATEAEARKQEEMQMLYDYLIKIGLGSQFNTQYVPKSSKAYVQNR